MKKPLAERLAEYAAEIETSIKRCDEGVVIDLLTDRHALILEAAEQVRKAEHR